MDLEADTLASHGDELPIGGFVLLDRRPGIAATLAQVSRGEMLKRVILKNFAHEVGATEVLDRLHDIVGGARCYRLSYADGAEAVDVLQAAFADRPSQSPSLAPTSATTTAASLHGQISRALGIVEKAVDGDMFLANPAGETIYHLNVIGAALWRLMDQPVFPGDVLATLRAAFPDVAAERIESDLDAMLSDLEKRRLIRTAGE